MRALLDATTPLGAALRTTLAATLAMALALALHVEVPALAVVFVLARGTAGAVAMLGGAVVGNLAAIALLASFDQSRAAFSLALLALTTLAGYASLGRRYPYAFVQFQLSLLILVGQALDAPDRAVLHAFYDLANVAIAAFATFVAGASQPFAVPEQLRRALAAALRALPSLCDPATADDAAVRLQLLALRARRLLAQAWPTRLTSRARHRALDAAVTAVDDLVRALLALRALARSRTSASGTAHDLERACADLATGAAAFAPLVVPSRPGPEDAAALRDEARAHALLTRRAVLAVEQQDTAAARLAQVARDALMRLALLAPLLPPGAASESRLASLEDRGALPPATRDRPPLDRYRLRHAVKAAASYQLVLWAWVAAEWGAIVPAFVVSVLVATLATPLGATLRKAALRVGGVLAGGLVGLAISIVLLPYVTELWTICVVVALPLFAFLLLQQRSERLAFASLQAAIALSLTLVHGPAPSPTWRAPLESLIGLAFGIVVVVGVMHAVWPIDAVTSARRTLAALVAGSTRRLAALLGSGEPDEAHDAAAARLDREHAAGFAHEVELYGGQFGRPPGQLARLVRLACEVDALAWTSWGARSAERTTALPAERAKPLPDDAARELASAAAALEEAGTEIARALVALPGELETSALDAALQRLRSSCATLGARAGEHGLAEITEFSAIATCVARVLDELRDGLAGPMGETLASRRAA